MIVVKQYMQLPGPTLHFPLYRTPDPNPSPPKKKKKKEGEGVNKSTKEKGLSYRYTIGVIRLMWSAIGDVVSNKHLQLLNLRATIQT